MVMKMHPRHQPALSGVQNIRLAMGATPTMSKFRQDRERRAGGDGDEVDPRSQMFKDLPDLFECLCGYRTEDGDDRMGMKLSIWVKNGHVKIALNDGEYEKIGFGDLDTEYPLGHAIQNLLDKGTIDWSDNKFPKKR